MFFKSIPRRNPSVGGNFEMSRSKYFLLFLLLNLLLGFAQAEEKTFLPENLSGLTNSAESDSVKI